MGIKYQLRLAAIIPVLVVALLFAVFYNGQFGRDLEYNLSHLGRTYVRQLLPTAQLALLREDHRTLQGLIDASTTMNPEIRSLAFYNAEGHLLAYRGGKHSLKIPFTLPTYTGDYVESKRLSQYSMHFIAPVTAHKFNIYSLLTFKIPAGPKVMQAGDILGWISIVMDTRYTLIKRYQMYMTTIFITLLGLLIALSVHYFLSKTIYLPIARLRRSMKQILRNEFETEIRIASEGEIGIIEQGSVHLQKQYLETRNDLNQYIEVATADLQKNLTVLEEKNIELSLEKKRLEEKSSQKSQFLANMSHEIRTPMNGIMGFSKVLLQSSLDPLQRGYVQTIQSSAQDLLNIVNDILDYSKIEAGKLHLDYIPVDIRSCIDEVITMLSHAAQQKGIDLMPSVTADLPQTLMGDPLRIKQIMTNLIGNAIKFTAQGYVLIRAYMEKESEKDCIICLSVTDTGIGISKEHQANLFTAFNQANTNITRQYGGSGLGLIICKKLTEHMHGKISLTSEVHQGSTFLVELKLAKLDLKEMEQYVSYRQDDLDSLRYQVRMLSPRLLIADDNAANRMLLTSLLGGYTKIELANDGQEALEICDEKQFDLILMDLQMPRLTGLEASTHIRKQSRMNLTTPVILISATNPNMSNQVLKKAGIQISLQKPLDEEELLRHFLCLLNEKKPAAIDWRLCVQKVSGNRALAEEYLACFIEELPKYKTEFLNFFQQQDYKNLEQAVHKLHGACCFCGVPQLQNQVAQVEALAKHGKQLHNLQNAFSLLIQEIDNVLNEYLTFKTEEVCP